jgi:gliding motility-associated-like protein
VSKLISINILQDNVILTTDTTICFNTTKQLRTQPALSFCWFPSTYLNDPRVPNPITSAPVPITYYFTAEMMGTNLIINGNFSGGNIGFTSGYHYAPNNITEGEYFVGPSPKAWNAALSSCTDHTTGNADMLLVNGSPVPDINVWKQTVPVTPNTNYAFSSWIQALYTPNPAKLSFSINGSDIGNLITTSLPTCTWTQFYTTWNSGNNTSAVISIANKNTEIQDNDFALDDISFAPVYIKRDSVKITIDTPMVRTLTDTATCKGTPVQLTSTGAVQYSWSPASGLHSASVSNPIATPADTTRYIVTGTNANGCTAKDTVMVFVRKLPVISKSANDTICLNQSIQLIASGGTGYSWSPAITLNNAGISNPVATPAATTTYTVVVTGTNKCVNSDSVKISIKPAQPFNVSPGIATCLNGKAQLNAGGGTSYLWSPAALLNSAVIANPVATVASNTLFTVIIKDDVCNLADTLFTNVTTDLALPNIAAAKSNDMDCVFNSVQLSVTGADVYVWTPATDLSSAVIANPVASPVVTRQYKVVGTNSISNCSSSDTITVFVKAPAAPKSYIPDAFTPNGDGTNDCFKVIDFASAKTVEVIIYNRYGNLVFQTKNPAECWDGKYKGQPSEPGNYVYFIRVINDCGEEVKKGNLLLLR